MNKEQTILRINKIGHIGAIICRVLRVLLLIGAIGTLIGIITLFIFPKNMVKISTSTSVDVSVDINKFIDGRSAAELDKLKSAIESDGSDNSGISINDEFHGVDTVTFEDGIIYVNTDDVSTIHNLADVRGSLIAVFFFLVCCVISIFYAIRLCRGFETCASPFDASIVSGLKSLAYSLIPMCVMSTVAEAVADRLVGNSSSFNFSFNLTSVLVILVILFLAYIFQYGAELQRESDETL